jgi:hypothetical protein
MLPDMTDVESDDAATATGEPRMDGKAALGDSGSTIVIQQENEDYWGWIGRLFTVYVLHRVDPALRGARCEITRFRGDKRYFQIQLTKLVLVSEGEICPGDFIPRINIGG